MINQNGSFAVALSSIALMVAALGFFLNAYQARRANRLSRAGFITECLKGFISDGDMQDAYYLIEYNRFEFGPSFQGSKEERQMDKLLRHFANLGLVWQNGLLSKRDIVPMRYYILRTSRNDGVREYLLFMEKWTSVSKTGPHPYQALMELARALET